MECWWRVWGWSWHNVHGSGDKVDLRICTTENVWKAIRDIAFHFWELEREHQGRKCGRTTVAKSNMATMIPVRRQFATPSQHLFREIATLEQWLLDYEERGRCPSNSSLRITGSRSTVPILAAVAPRFTLTKETFVVFACISQTSVRWNLTLWGGLAPFVITRSLAIAKWQYYRFEKTSNFWNYMWNVISKQKYVQSVRLFLLNMGNRVR